MQSAMNAIGIATDALGAWLLTASVQVAVVGVAIAVVDRAISRWAWPQLRAAMWWMVMLALVVPPFFESPISLWRYIDPAADIHELVRPPVLAADLQIADMFEATSAKPAGVRNAWSRTGFRTVVGLWLAGLGLLTITTYLRMNHACRMWLREPPLPQPPWLKQLIRDSARRLHLRKVPMVRIHRGAPGAAVIGTWRPVIVLPARLLETSSRTQVQHILLHEMAHLGRFDTLTARLILLIQLAYWFHPIAWLARWRLETLREICCDQAVVAALNDSAGDYRRTLLRLARSMLDGQASPAPLAFVHRHSQIMARLMYLQRPLPGRPAAVRAVASAVLAVLMLCCVPRMTPTSQPANKAQAISWSELPGCFQLRYAVMRAMADQAANERSD